LSHSVICAFDIEDIDRLFAISPYYTKDKNRNVYLRKRRDEASRKLGQCHNHSNQLTEDEAIMLRSHPLMVDSIPSVFGRAVGVYQGDDHYNQIAVLEKVPINSNETQGVDVMYVGTDRGNIIKMVNLNGKKTDGKEDSILKVATYKVSNLPIRRLLIKDDRLIAVTDRVVYGLPLHFCSKYQSCHECISSRDPHCAWNLQENRCVFNDKLNSKKSVLYQDVNHGNTSACPSLKIEEIIPVIEKVAPAETITRKPEDFRANELEENEECDCDENEKTKSKKDLRHSAICDCSKTKDVKKAENGLFGQTSPVVSSEKDEETFKFWPWIIMLVVIQAAIIIGLVAAVWMYRNRYVKRSKLSTSIHTQSTVINAYETPMPINVGTLRHSESLRSPTRPMISKTYSAGDIDIHTRLEGSSTIIPIYAHTHAHAQTP
uniref:Sema domain-containing protein n=1 Tax=Acrobeloides nanus TaxID=290746 RepID=A0A914CRS0_9BILA